MSESEKLSIVATSPEEPEEWENLYDITMDYISPKSLKYVAHVSIGKKDPRCFIQLKNQVSSVPDLIIKSGFYNAHITQSAVLFEYEKVIVGSDTNHYSPIAIK